MVSCIARTSLKKEMYWEINGDKRRGWDDIVRWRYFACDRKKYLKSVPLSSSLLPSRRIVLSWLILFSVFFSVAGDINRPEVLRNFDVGAARACVFAIDDMTAINKVWSEKMMRSGAGDGSNSGGNLLFYLFYPSYLLCAINILLIPYEFGIEFFFGCCCMFWPPPVCLLSLTFMFCLFYLSSPSQF